MRDIFAPPYKGPMQPHKNNDGFTQRLTTCVDRVGGKRALANAALISEAQLFRYLNAESDVPSDRLVAIAKAAKVDAGWLLTGNGEVAGGEKDPRPGFRAELMRQVAQTFDELLVESDKTFSPRQRAIALAFLYEALRIEEVRSGTEMTVDRKLAPFYPDFLAPLRSDNRLEQYHSVMNTLEYGGEMSFQSMLQFDTHVKLAMLGVFDSAAGELFFEKMGNSLLPEAVRNITQLVDESVKLIGKNTLNWLDAGCGNGRHLAFLHQHFPNLSLKGFDGSKQAVFLSNHMTKAGKLPIGIIEEADFRSLPYADDSFDVVYCRLGLHLMPYLPGCPVGATKFLSETQRILRKGGVVHLLTYEGTGCDYITFTQYHNEASIRQLAAETGLSVQMVESCGVSETGGKAGQDYSNKFDRGLRVVLRK